MIRKCIQLLSLAIVYCLVLTACSLESNMDERTDEVTPVQLYAINTACIDAEIHDIFMQNNIEGTVEMTVQIPDYEALYKMAYASEDPDKYMLQVLKSGQYDSCERVITARVTIENGEEVVHTDEAITQLLERELSNAINALMEEYG